VIRSPRAVARRASRVGQPGDSDLIQTLTTIEDVQAGSLGPPADTDCPVIDRSYSYAELLIFRDQAAHDRYQVHPTHRHFVERCATFWKRVVIYDSLG
jgi:hypothetical protein